MQSDSVQPSRRRATNTRPTALRAASVAVLMGLGLIAFPSVAALASAPSAVTLKMSAPAQEYGSPIAVQASAMANRRAGVGTLQYIFDGRLAAQARADGDGKAVWRLQGSIPVGSHRLVVKFLPSSAGVRSSTSQITVVVKKATPVISVAVPSSRPPFGSNTTMTMAVSARNLGRGTGSVQLYEGSRYVGSANLGNGVAQIHFRLVSTPGNNVFTVRYSGSGSIAAGSRAVRFVTSRAIPRLSIGSVSAGTSSGRVAVSVGGGPRPATGTVSAVIDNRTVSSARLSASGAATLSLPGLSSGGHTLKVRYSGDLRYVNAVVAKSISVAAPPPMINPCSASARACVDLTHNKAWIQEGGRIIYGPAPMLSGRSGYRTDPGTFAVYWKDIDHKSSIFDDAPMPYAIFFDGGTAFHEGSLSIQSHGCIHLSSAAARYFWNALDYGDTVQVVGHSPY